MNIFRELVEELKDENLLEQTVIERPREDSESVQTGSAGEEKKEIDGPPDAPPTDESAGTSAANAVTSEVEVTEKPIQMPDGGIQDSQPAADESGQSTIENKAEIQLDGFEVEGEAPAGVELPEPTAGPMDEEIADTDPESPTHKIEKAAVPSNHDKAAKLEQEKKFYRQRAMDEVTGLQLVEHVLTGVEREQMKSAAKSFDDLAVKRSLHDFLKVADDLNSPEHAKAEFQLMQETENWCSALSRRDRNISVAHLRRYCETTKPSLSSQAMISLARFYRNSPYSESVRGKFDLVFTKLFSKDQGGDMRSVVFKNGELVQHVQELYADWSSIPLYSTEEDDSDLLLTALKFQDFINEAQSADSFDELVRKDFFKRLKVFKEKTNENFFAPLVVAAAIESNVIVGNRYVELIQLERLRSAGKDLGDKYGIAHDSSISESTSKTLELLDMLQAKKPEALEKPLPVANESVVKETKQAAVKRAETPAKKFTFTGGANKWLIVATVVVLAVTAWLFLQGTMEFSEIPSRDTGSAKEVSLSGTTVGNYVHSARISRSTMFGITRDSWNDLSKQEKEVVVRQALEVGQRSDFDKVQLLNTAGKSMAYGSKTRVAVY